jgi:hypothetical protein
MMSGLSETKPEIALAPGADETALAVMLADIIRINLETKSEKLKDFNALRARVYIHATDAEVEITLDFARGLLTVHSGKVEQPQISIITDSSTLMDLTNLQIKGGMPYFFDQTGRDVTKKLFRGELKIKGLIAHLASLVRVTKVLSVA